MGQYMSSISQNCPQIPHPLWRLGFRPFFIFSGVFAVIAIALWVMLSFGLMTQIGTFSPIYWHAHEMIYGYTTAVIAGFLLTASQNWTGIRGVHGHRLQALFGLWILGRVAMASPALPAILVAITDLAFYPVLALTMVPYLKPADMKTERVFFFYFTLYFCGNLLMHLDTMGIYPGLGLRGALLGVYVTLVVILFMGGRVIPFFSESERARKQPKTNSTLEIFSHISAWCFLVSQVLIPYSKTSAIIAFATSAIHLVRMSGWYVRRVRRVALLAVLYLAYLWLIVGIFMSGLTSLGLLIIGPSIHALTIGGLGMMTYGMMTRVALGHTGRRLVASKTIAIGYFALCLAAIVRVFGPIMTPLSMNWWLGTSGLFWITAFLIFIAIYAPILFSPRVDQKLG